MAYTFEELDSIPVGQLHTDTEFAVAIVEDIDKLGGSVEQSYEAISDYTRYYGDRINDVKQ